MLWGSPLPVISAHWSDLILTSVSYHLNIRNRTIKTIFCILNIPSPSFPSDSTFIKAKRNSHIKMKYIMRHSLSLLKIHWPSSTLEEIMGGQPMIHIPTIFQTTISNTYSCIGYWPMERGCWPPLSWSVPKYVHQKISPPTTVECIQNTQSRSPRGTLL